VSAAVTTPQTRPLTRLRLRGRSRRVALTAHILASVGWFGIALLVAFCTIAAASSDPATSQALYRAIQISSWLSIPAGLAALATGVVLGAGTRFGLVRHWWIVAKLVIAAAVIVTDALLVGRAAHHALISGQATAGLYGSTIAHVVVLAIATALSVFKPKGRTPWGPTPPH